MARALLITLGWLLAAAGLYGALLILELYWNLYDWQPKPDLKALGIIFGVCSALVLIWILARATCHRVTQGGSLVVCISLLALAVYVFPREPLTQGVFARERSSPLWYRAGRFALLATPTAFWVLGLLRIRKP